MGMGVYGCYVDCGHTSRSVQAITAYLRLQERRQEPLRLASRRFTPFIWLLSKIAPFRFAPVCIQPFARYIVSGIATNCVGVCLRQGTCLMVKKSLPTFQIGLHAKPLSHVTAFESGSFQIHSRHVDTLYHCLLWGMYREERERERCEW